MPTRDERLEAVPYPTCCEGARHVIFFTIDSLSVWKGPGWYVSVNRERLPPKIRRFATNARKAKFCPLCGEELPELRQMAEPPEPFCEIREDHLYCHNCGERLMACNCYPPEAGWECVPPDEDN